MPTMTDSSSSASAGRTKSNSPKQEGSDLQLNPQSSSRRTRSAFDYEPNPFEQSFSRSSDPDKSSSPKPTLPPLASLASPGNPSYSWGLTSAGLTNSNSLRSGPLSPAMLSGPAQNSNSNSNSITTTNNNSNSNSSAATNTFDHSTFRSGLTPGTGLTPLVAGPAAFPPPSPNTAAFLAMVTGATHPGSLASITPNTLSVLTGSLSDNPSSATANASQSTMSFDPGQQQQSSAQPSSAHSHSQVSAANAATTAANGLFLLSQAHHELTKREEAQARAGKIDTNGDIGIAPSSTSKRGAKRKVEDSAPPKSAPKKTKGIPSPRKRKGQTPSDGSADEDDEEDEEDNEHLQSSTSPTSQNGMLTHKNTKEMTDEEKRKNFLERNRQAALKCRQRKKAWLAQLQAKVEFLSTENERLTTALVSSREEISRLNALVGAHPPPHMQNGHGHMQNGNPGHVMGPSQPPVSVAVSLQSNGKNVVVPGHPVPPPPAGVTAGGSGRGYGY